MAGNIISRKESKTLQLASSEFYCSSNIMLEDKQRNESSLEVEIDKIKILPQVRRDIKEDYDSEEMEDLMNSIKSNGLLNPITLRREKATNELLLVAGHRRLNAFKKLGLKKIPATIKELTDEQAVFAQMSENLTRKNLRLQDVAAGIKQLKETINPKTNKPYTFEELSGLLGASKSNLSRYYSFYNARPEVIELYESGTIRSLSTLVMVADAMKIDPDGILEYIKAGNVSREQIRKYVSKLKNKEEGATKSTETESVVSHATNVEPKTSSPTFSGEEETTPTNEVVAQTATDNSGESPVNVRKGSLDLRFVQKKGQKSTDHVDDEPIDIEEFEPTPENWKLRRIVVRYQNAQKNYVYGELYYDMNSEHNDKTNQTYVWLRTKSDEIIQVNSKSIEIVSIDDGSTEQ